MNTLEGNKLIALFRGWVESGFDRQLIFNSDTGEEFKLEDLKFHTSWDWLMPVLEKINSPMKVKIYGQYRGIQGEQVNIITHRSAQSKNYINLKIEYGRRFKEITEYRKDGETMLEPTYRLVIQFIKWYNNQNK